MSEEVVNAGTVAPKRRDAVHDTLKKLENQRQQLQPKSGKKMLRLFMGANDRVQGDAKKMERTA